jgi:opacity protein-like surface antigen
MFRAEAEAAYKHLGVESVDASGPFGSALAAIGADVDEDDFDGAASVTSLMGNVLLDFGGDAGVGAYVGAGIGVARVKVLDDRDSGLAWQGIAGLRMAVSDNLDVGLKYRYFNSSKLDLSNDFTGTGGPFTIEARDRLQTHSLLLSLVYNLVAAAPPPPPPPPPAPVAPATQTCPDGSVILATDACPPPPPPPPPPPVERGERG